MKIVYFAFLFLAVSACYNTPPSSEINSQTNQLDTLNLQSFTFSSEKKNHSSSPWSRILEQVDSVFVARVVDTKVRQGKDGERGIEVLWTDSALKIEQVLYLSDTAIRSGDLAHLTFLGGDDHDQALHVSNGGVLKRGDRAIFFVLPCSLKIANQDPAVCQHHPATPLLGGNRGLLRIINGRIFTGSGQPILSITKDGLHPGLRHAPVEQKLDPLMPGSSASPLHLQYGPAESSEQAIAQLKKIFFEVKP